MAINIRFTCGCGKSYGDIEEAAKHSDEKNHIMTIQGTIVPDREEGGPLPS